MRPARGSSPARAATRPRSRPLGANPSRPWEAAAPPRRRLDPRLGERPLRPARALRQRPAPALRILRPPRRPRHRRPHRRLSVGGARGRAAAPPPRASYVPANGGCVDLISSGQGRPRRRTARRQPLGRRRLLRHPGEPPAPGLRPGRHLRRPRRRRPARSRRERRPGLRRGSLPVPAARPRAADAGLEGLPRPRQRRQATPRAGSARRASARCAARARRAA